MTTYASLIELSNELSVGDYVLWIGDHAVDSAGETSTPNEVTAIEHGSEWIRVDGVGVDDGQYYYRAYHDGASEAFYVNPNAESESYQGEVVVARVTGSEEPVPVKEMYDDLR